VTYGNDKVRPDLNGFFPDGSCALISEGSDSTLRIWNLNANAEIATLWLPAESGGWSATFDPPGRRMAVAAGRPYVDLWDLAALRRELARGGLDWPDEHPGEGFAAPRP
jgi:WD40 repeat protein